MKKTESIPFLGIADPRNVGGPEPHFFCGRFEEELRRPPQRRALHRHHFHEVFLLLHGQGEYLCDFERHPFGPGRMIFVSPGQVHGWEASEEVRGVVLTFGPELWGKCGDSHFLHGLPFFFAPARESQIDLPASDLRLMARFMDELEGEFLRPIGRDPVILRARLEIILCEAARLVRGDDVESSGDIRRKLTRRFLLELEEHFREWHAAEKYARALNVTPRVLKAATVETLGKSVRQLKEERVALEARRALAHGTLTVAEIGFDLGFSDASHFSRFFRRRVGHGPREFREQSRG
ncbi:MAG: helix-turn-helix transcriptional regulator [Chthoniobacteraceae bacterium]